MKKRNIWIIILVILGIGFAIYQGIVSKKLEEVIIAQLEDNLKCKIDIADVGTNFISQITVNDLKISTFFPDIEIIQIEKLKIKYNLFSLFRNKFNFFQAIYKIDLYSPQIFLTNRTGEWNVSQFFDMFEGNGEGNLPRLVFFINEGKISIEEKESNFKGEIKELNGNISLGENIFVNISLNVFGTPVSLLSELSYKDELLTISSVSGEIEEGLYQFEGDIDFSLLQPLINLNYKIEKFKISNAQASFTFNSQGVFKGRLISPLGEGNFSITNLKLGEKEFTPITGNYRYATNVLYLEGKEDTISFIGNLDFSEGIKVKEFIVQIKPQGLVRIDGEYNSDKPEPINFLIQAKKLKGVPDLQINLGGNTKNLSLVGVVDSPSFKKVNFDTKIDFVIKTVKGDFGITSLNDGIIEGVFITEFAQKKLNPFQIKINAKNFLIYEEPLKGEVLLTGKYQTSPQIDMQADLKSSLEYNGYLLKDIESEIFYQNEILQIKNLKIAKEIKGNLNISSKKPYDLDGQIQIITTNLNKLIEKFNFSIDEEIKGKYQGDLVISGSLEKPVLKMNGEGKNGEFRGINFTLLTNAIYTQKKIYFQKSSIKILPEGLINFSGEIDFDSPQPLKIDAQVSKLSSQVFKAFFKNRDILWEGIINGTIKIKGPFYAPQLQIIASSQDNKFRDFKISQIETDTQINILEKETVILINSLNLIENSGKIYLDNPAQVIITNAKIDFQSVFQIRNFQQAGLNFFGKVQINGESFLSPQELSLIATIKFNNFWINQYCVEENGIKINLENKNLQILPLEKYPYQLTGNLNFLPDNKISIPKISLLYKNNKIMEMKGTLAPTYFLTLNTYNEGLDIGIFAKLLNYKEPVQGQLHCKIEAESKKDFPEVKAEINVDKAKISNLNLGGIKINLTSKKGIIFLEEGEISGTDNKYKILLEGAIPYLADSPINLDIWLSEGNLAILEIFPDYIRSANGTLDFSIHLGGTLNNPLLTGKINASGNLYGKQIFEQVRNLNCDIEMVDNNLKINYLTGQIGQGKINIKGEVLIEKNKIKTVDLKVITDEKGIKLEFPFLPIPQSSILGEILPGIPSWGEPQINLHIYNRGQDLYIAGEVILENARFNFKPQVKMVSTRPQQNIYLDLTLKSGKNTWYENEFLECQVEGEIHFSDAISNLNIEGEIFAIQGVVKFLGNNYQLREGTMEFKGKDIYLQARAEYPIENDIIVVTIPRDKLEKIRPTFSSKNDPQMAEERVLSKALVGIDVSEFTTEERDMYLRKEILRLINNTFASPFIENIIRRTGLIDVVKVEFPVTNLLTAQEFLFTGTEVSLGRYFSPDLYASYNVRLDALTWSRLELKHEVELLYRLREMEFLRAEFSSEERFLGIERRIRW